MRLYPTQKFQPISSPKLQMVDKPVGMLRRNPFKTTASKMEALVREQFFRQPVVVEHLYFGNDSKLFARIKTVPPKTIARRRKIQRPITV
jgi:hypothetical protein